MLEDRTKILSDEDYETEDIADLNEAVEDKINKEDIKPIRKLDYTLENSKDRNELVTKICAETPREQLTPRYLEILADYIIFAMDKEEKRQKRILTDNRMVTVNKRETSFQGLAEQFENGEDGIYDMMTNDKNIIFTPKITITDEDIAEIPELKELRDAISAIEKQFKAASGKKKFLLKKQLIEMRQDQYVIKNSYRKPIYPMNLTKSINQLDLDENITIDEEGNIQSDGLITLLNPKHISALLCNYSQLKKEVYGKFQCDAYYLMEDLEGLIERTLKLNYPLYYDLTMLKIDGMQNAEIQQALYKRHNIKHSVEYLSSLWRNKIPKLLAEKAQEEYLIWYFTFKEYGQWKKCSRCGEIKLAHNRFFSKNKTSKDNFYSICKECRNAKNKNKEKVL